MNSEQSLFSLAAASVRWGGLSVFSIRRHIKAGSIRAVRVGGRVFIPLDEIERVETNGTGQPRKPRKVCSSGR